MFSGIDSLSIDAAGPAYSICNAVSCLRLWTCESALAKCLLSFMLVLCSEAYVYALTQPVCIQVWWPAGTESGGMSRNWKAEYTRVCAQNRTTRTALLTLLTHLAHLQISAEDDCHSSTSRSLQSLVDQRLHSFSLVKSRLLLRSISSMSSDRDMLHASSECQESTRTTRSKTPERCQSLKTDMQGKPRSGLPAGFCFSTQQ